MIITIALIVAVAAIVGFGVALTVRSKRDFGTANEVVPGVRSPAPASWAGAHSPEAKLHRRLRDAVAGARANPRLVELGLAERTRQLETDALALDDRLVAAAGLPAPHRAGAVAAVEPAVVALEDAVAALVLSTTVGQSRELYERQVSDADIKLQALAAARAEVEQLDLAVSDPGRVIPSPDAVGEQPAPTEHRADDARGDDEGMPGAATR